MKRALFLLFFIFFTLLSAPVSAQISVQFEEIGSGGLVYPVAITNAGDGSGRLFVLELEGRIRIFKNGELLQTPFLDISSRVYRDGEAGLAGLAFHPRYSENGRFFVYYVTGSEGDLKSVVSEFRASLGNPDMAAPEEKKLLEFDRPTPLHLGGDLAFGPEGCLYIASGDGGDHELAEYAQDPSRLLGKILRIDVDGGDPYRTPPDNPFLNNRAFRPEIWALGFRNPWRFGFDRRSGELFVGDVGSNLQEEVNIVKKGGNYGWPRTEGFLCRRGQDCEIENLQAPIYAYEREPGGAAVIGGRVYRGSAPALYGRYVLADFVSRRIWALQDSPQGWSAIEIAHPDFRVGAFGEDEAGELYVVDLVRGRVCKLVARYEYGFGQVGSGRYPGGEFYSELILSNPGQESSDVWFRAYSPEGQPLRFQVADTDDDVFHETLPPGTSRTLRFQPGEEIQSGWLQVLSDRVIGRTLRLVWESAQGERLASVSVEPSVRACRYLVEGRLQADKAASMGIAVANPYFELLDGELEVFDKDGQKVGSRELHLERFGQQTEFLEDLAPQLDEFRGTIRLRSQRPLLVMTLGTRRGLATDAVRGSGSCAVP